ncbi:MAG: alpha/beta fold hydrolase, partial [Dehalococcoidia bacterium]
MSYATAADGVRLHFEAAGAGRPVLLITGAFSSLEDWHDAGIFEELARERRVIAMDLRGHGRSDRPHDAASYGWPKNASDAFAVLEAEGASGADVYGFSMGGQVVVAMLNGDTSRLRSVAAMGVYVPPPGFEPPAAQLVERARLLREQGLTAATINGLLLGVDDPE